MPVSAAQSALINEYGKNLTAIVHANLLSQPQHSIFLDSCYHHCGGWGSYHVGNTTQPFAMKEWYDAVDSRDFPDPSDTPDLNGTVVFSAGLGGVPNYRIPAIVQTTGTPPALVAFAEARNGSDDTASRIAVRTSTDGGVTWSAVVFAVGSLNSSASRAACAKDNFTHCRVGNPAAVFDAASGGVVLAYVVRGFSAVGEDAIGNGISISADGKTWGKPTDVSTAFAGLQPNIPSDCRAGMPGPGTALLLESGPQKGRLLVPSYLGRIDVAQVTVSDDHGATWHTTNQTFGRVPGQLHGGMGESALTQLPNGSVLLSMRRSPQLPRTGGRTVAVSNDGGDTFGPISFDGPQSNPLCQGSIVSFGDATYFSAPAQASSRGNLTIKKSTDNTVTWGKSLLVEAGNSEGYSCLVKGAIQGGDGKASTDGGILYEAADGTIKFSRFPLSLDSSTGSAAPTGQKTWIQGKPYPCLDCCH